MKVVKCDKNKTWQGELTKNVVLESTQIKVVANLIKNCYINIQDFICEPYDNHKAKPYGIDPKDNE